MSVGYLNHSGTQDALTELIALLQNLCHGVRLCPVGVLPHHRVVQCGVKRLTVRRNLLQSELFERFAELAHDHVDAGLVFLSGGRVDGALHVVERGQQGF